MGLPGPSRKGEGDDGKKGEEGRGVSGSDFSPAMMASRVVALMDQTTNDVRTHLSLKEAAGCDVARI